MELPLHELVEAMTCKNRLIKMERMKRGYLDVHLKENEVVYTDKVILTYEGNELPSEVQLYNNLVRVRVRPFIEPVLLQVF